MQNDNRLFQELRIGAAFLKSDHKQNPSPPYIKLSPGFTPSGENVDTDFETTGWAATVEGETLEKFALYDQVVLLSPDDPRLLQAAITVQAIGWQANEIARLTKMGLEKLLDHDQAEAAFKEDPEPIPMTVGVARLALMSDNPKLWLAKYRFYMGQLGTTQEEAIRFCAKDVDINTEARKEFNLPSAKSMDFGLEMQHFSLQHSDTVGPFVSIMLSVYGTCQASMVSAEMDLDEVHSHVFGSDEVERCRECFTAFNREVAQQKQAIR